LFASAEAARSVHPTRFSTRLDSLLHRAAALRRLRAAVSLPRASDLSEPQWIAVEAELSGLARAIERRARAAARRWEPEPGLAARRRLHEELGELELKAAESYGFFDTFMDALTQRHAPSLGPLLKGCDALAKDALDRAHPALRLAGDPVVFLNRGFGAAMVRSGVMLSEAGRNPVPLIQLPYARLQEKYNLASLLHEVGHEALVRLRVRGRLVRAVRRRLHGRFEASVRDRVARWTTELAPDFWAFGCIGPAQAATVRDILAVPSQHALMTSSGVHPPPYLRVRAAFHWCRTAFGRGAWDEWEREWLTLYPLERASEPVRARMQQGLAALPYVSAAFFEEPLAPLAGRPLVSLFDLARVAPSRLAAQMRGQTDDSPRFRCLRPCEQLAVYRLLRLRPAVSEQQLDQSMTRWLCNLTRTTRTE
jgi:hypothetical protein